MGGVGWLLKLGSKTKQLILELSMERTMSWYTLSESLL